jgi:hypothetical protein
MKTPGLLKTIGLTVLLGFPTNLAADCSHSGGVEILKGLFNLENRGQIIYTVKEGDNLWNLAKVFYGEGYMWPTIDRDNFWKIGLDVNKIRPGIRLLLDRDLIEKNIRQNNYR